MKKVTRKIIEIDEEKCDGCGLCVPSCAEGAIAVIDGKARLVADRYCDGLGACLGECPQDALHVVEREADEFDEEAVEHHLQAVKPTERTGEEAQTLACGCPSAAVQQFADAPAPSCPGSAVRSASEGPSALTHWPVQIRLVPPTAPFLKGAELLVLADCVGPAYPHLHGDLLDGKVVMMGCPKFDDLDGYVEKFAEVFRRAGIRSVTIAIMEVPCCAGLVGVVETAMREAGVSIPVEQVVIGVRGDRRAPMKQSA